MSVDIQAQPDAPQYNVELGLVGRINSGGGDGVILTMTRDDRTTGISDPNDYFQLYDGSQGIMIKLIRSVDRDVSAQ